MLWLAGAAPENNRSKCETVHRRFEFGCPNIEPFTSIRSFTYSYLQIARPKVGLLHFNPPGVCGRFGKGGALVQADLSEPNLLVEVYPPWRYPVTCSNSCRLAKKMLCLDYCSGSSWNRWSPASIKHNLQQMADDGVIERKRVRRGPHETNLYFRSRIEGPVGAIAFPPSARSG